MANTLSMVRRVALVLTAVLAAALVGLPSAPLAPAGAADAALPKTYVALGDSFASGPAIPVQELTGCLRSTNNYAKHLASKLGHALRDVTCSGADTEDMTDWQGVSPERQYNGRGVPPQLDALKHAGEDVELVTLQIGGNDIGFGSIAQDCLAEAQKGGSCRGPHIADDGDSRGGIEGNGVDDLRDRIAGAAPKVAATIEQINELRPEAKVLVLGYSGIFAFGDAADCPAMLVGREDALYLRGVQEALNEMIAAQAAAAADAGRDVRYVDLYRPSAGHTACDAPGIRWVEPIVPVNAAAPIHPNLTGMLAAADILEEVATRDEAIAASLRCPATSTTEPWVLLVHGTGVTPAENWSWGYEPALARRGFGVCTVALPQRALNDIQISGEFVAHAIRTMYGASGRRISIVGHSQGGLVPRWALRWSPELRVMVDDLVTLGSPHQGTTVAQQTVNGYTCEACHQMQQGSAFLGALNSWQQSPGAVSYTSIWTDYDEMVRPTTNAALGGPGSVANIRIQGLGGNCAYRAVDHLGLAGDAAAHWLVLDALDHEGPASKARFPTPSFSPNHPCNQGTFATDLIGQTSWSSGAFQDQWRNGDGGRPLGARYGTVEPSLAPYVREARLQLDAPGSATATDPVTVTASLTDVGGQPLAGREVTFRLGSSQVAATTSSAGTATATLVVDADAGPAVIRAVFEGDPDHRQATAQRELTVLHEDTALAYVGETSARGDTVTLAARLHEPDAGLALAGRTVRFAIAGVTATAVTDATGVATAQVTVVDHGRARSVVATFDGDRRYRSSTTEATISWGRA